MNILIRVCGISSVVFVLAIFLFVFREGAGALTSPNFHLGQFLFSGDWSPVSSSGPRYGTLALAAGTGSVTLLAMIIAVPLGIGSAIFLSEFCSPF
jgi:phosphate transport system permease protein